MARRLLFIIGVLTLCAAVPAVSAAADIDIQRLQGYYAQSLKSAKSEKAYAPLIAAERARIRALVEKDIDVLVQQPEGDANVEPAKAIDRQRQLVSDLTGRLNESTVDLNLLKDEETLYKDGKSASGSFLMTKSYPELLARKVVLEENVDLLGAALGAQQTRLQKLLSEERTANMGLFLSILWYLAVVLGVIWAEHFLRTQLLLRIPHRGVRYALSKVFTMIVYMSLIFWLVSRILAEYPTFTTVFAVIGAALVFMLQDVIKSFLGWLTYKGSLKLGDRVSLGGVTGDVLDIGLLHTTLLGSRSPGLQDVTQAGKIIRVPNAQLLIGNLVNYHSTSDFENVEIPLYLADPAQGDRAAALLEDFLNREAAPYTAAAKRQMDHRMRGFYFSQVSPSHRVYLEVTEKRELKIVLCFPAPIGQRRTVTTRILREAIVLLQKEGIGLAKMA